MARTITVGTTPVRVDIPPEGASVSNSGATVFHSTRSGLTVDANEGQILSGQSFDFDASQYFVCATSTTLTVDTPTASLSSYAKISYAAAVLADSPVSYWRLDESSGTVASDTKSTNHGVYTGTFTLNRVGATTSDLLNNKGVLLDGSTAYVTVPDDNSLDLLDTFTVEAWIKKAVDNNSMTVVSKGVNAYMLQLDGANKLYLEKEGVSAVVVSTTTITGTAWHHVAATKSGATVKLYIDGADVTSTVTNATFADTASALNIGRRVDNATAFWNGTVDDVAVYNTALSAARILAHFNAA